MIRAMLSRLLAWWRATPYLEPEPIDPERLARVLGDHADA